MLDNESSQRINLLRFPLIVGVVFVHNYGTSVGTAGGTIGTSQHNLITEFIQNLISDDIGRIASALFFLMSGYLFFTGFDGSKTKYLAKLKNRVHTLLVPFLFWNMATLLLIALAQAVPTTRAVMAGQNAPISGFGLGDYISAIFGIGRDPISYQFWFVRDLMLLVLLVPVISFANRFVPLPFLLGAFACWVLGVWPIYAPAARSLFFFSAGGYLASRGLSLFCLDKYGKYVLWVYPPVVVSDALLIHAPIHRYLLKVGIALGVATALIMTKLAAKSPGANQAILSLSGCSFFVYAAHEPLLSAVRKAAYLVFSPQSPFLVLALYFLVPIVVVVTLVASYRVLLSLWPRAVYTITGGRERSTSR
jgi:fucose 4-O-acetylase-like acetyltransferase